MKGVKRKRRRRGKGEPFLFFLDESQHGDLGLIVKKTKMQRNKETKGKKK